MPLPEPAPDEMRDDFMERCMADLADEFPDAPQREAVCQSQWRKKEMASTNEIWIYDDIGPDYWGLISAKSVLRDLEAIGKGKPVTVRMNSPGGDIVEAQAIYNALRRHSAGGGHVTTANDALAASAASFIFMAGDTRRMAPNSMTMIHCAWTIQMGNADQMRASADVLDKFDKIQCDTYCARSGQKSPDVMQMMQDETWMTADEAMANSFCDEIGDEMKMAASLVFVSPGRFAKTPERFIGQPEQIIAARAQRRQATARKPLESDAASKMLDEIKGRRKAMGV